MKVGLMLPAMVSMELNEMVLQGAEALGMDSVWLPDHLLGPFHPELWKDVPASAAVDDSDAFLDPFCVAAVLGRQTSLTMGTCVTDTTRRRGPDLARAALTLQRSARGDFVLGLGSGEAESLLPFGYEFTRPIGLLEQALCEIRSLFDTGTMPGGDGHGRTGLRPAAPGDTPQIWVAANGPRTLRLTGTYADGWLPMGGISPQEYATCRAVVNDAAATAGRPEPVAALFPLVILGRSRDHVAELFDTNPLTKMILLFAPAQVWARHGLEHPCGPECRGYPDTIPHALDADTVREALKRIPRAMAEDYILTGSAVEIADQLDGYRQVGLQHVVLADLTGLSYDPETAQSLMPEYGKLRGLLQQEPAVA